MLNIVDNIRKEISLNLDPKKKAALGQYFTPSPVAAFMASLFKTLDNRSIRLLDAGAGIGSLVTAFIDRLQKDARFEGDLEIIAYDLESNLLDYLEKNVGLFKEMLEQKRINISLQKLNKDFINDGVRMIKDPKNKSFTHAILNPPYKKIHSESKHRQLLAQVQLESVNLYSAFIALSLKLLGKNGELVAIIPRSFCSGKYYKNFRNLILNSASIKHIHLFEARDKAFEDDKILQENIIIHLIKGAKQGLVSVTRSTDASFSDLKSNKFHFNRIIKPKDEENVFHIPQVELNLLESSKTFVYSLSDIGLSISTGPVVDFRSKEFLLEVPATNCAPLIYPSHFNCKEIDWPKKSKRPNAIAVNSATRKLLFPSGFYTVVRRFSSKEEKQRIVARVINPNMLHAKLIGIENHLNVFHFEKKGISEDLAYGLAAFLNSSYVDRHFRSFSSHTQVNATDLSRLKYPSKKILQKVGLWAKTQKSFDQNLIDKILSQYI